MDNISRDTIRFGYGLLMVAERKGAMVLAKQQNWFMVMLINMRLSVYCRVISISANLTLCLTWFTKCITAFMVTQRECVLLYIAYSLFVDFRECQKA